MKRIGLVLLVICLLTMVCTGCQELATRSEMPEGVRYRVLSIYSGEGLRDFTGAYDFDFDGENEDIKLHIQDNNDDPWDGGEVMELSIGAYKAEIESYGAELVAAYVTDLNLNDNVMDLALFTVEGSSDPVLRIFNYENELPMWAFECFDKDEKSWKTEPVHWLGYASSFVMDIDDYGTVTIEEQTSSVGMWSVYKNYKMENGVLKEVVAEQYEILPDYMDKEFYAEILEAEEYTKWKQGYIKAYKAYANAELSIAEGSYFKVLYDDGMNHIYVETEAGQSGWIDIDYNAFDREIHPYYFGLAG